MSGIGHVHGVDERFMRHMDQAFVRWKVIKLSTPLRAEDPESVFLC
jgi:hypothetical protein